MFQYKKDIQEQILRLLQTKEFRLRKKRYLMFNSLSIQLINAQIQKLLINLEATNNFIKVVMILRGERTRINEMLMKQRQNIAQMHYFNDEDQEQSLTSRSNIIKNNYKYINKIEKAEQTIRKAKEINIKMLQKNKKAIQRLSEPKRVDIKSIQKLEQSSIKNLKQIQPVSHQRAFRKSKNTTQVSHTIHKQTLEISSIKQKQQQVEDEKLQPIPEQLKSIAVSKSILNVEYKIVKNYFADKLAKITSQTTPQQVYKIFYPFYELCGIKINLPLIKKYKNCTYFGQSKQENNQNLKYEGFLIFSTEEKIYYGQLQNQKKNGNGIEMDFINDIIYIGTFQKGKKNGQFTVIKPDQTYKGQLKKGQYYGFGQLTTAISVYKGFFQNNMRHGKGQEQFKSGLTIQGEFFKNKFTNVNMNEKSESFRINTIKTNISKDNKSMTIRSINPQKKIQNKSFEDKNIFFEASPYKNNNFQQFNCQFGVQESEDEFQNISARKTKTFRIKQAQKAPTSQNKRSLSFDNKDSFYFKK